MATMTAGERAQLAAGTVALEAEHYAAVGSAQALASGLIHDVRRDPASKTEVF